MPIDSGMVPPPARMAQLTMGTMVSQAISAAAALGVADTLVDGPCQVNEIAARVGADAPGIYRLMRALADVGVFEELDGRRFASTSLGDLLRADAPGSLRAWAIMLGRSFHRQAWTGLEESLRTGEPAFERIHGQPCFDYCRDHPEDGEILDAAMTAVSSQFIATVVQQYEFAAASTVVDVGGGRGGLIAAILTANPHLRGVLFDLPHVVARQVVDQAGVGDRCSFTCGDFFDSVPPGGDVYVLSNIIHDWADETAVRILHNCRAAMGLGGRVLLAEAVLRDDGVPSRTVWADLEMLVMNVRGARQRTENEFRELLARAGLRMTGVVARGHIFDLVEAVPTEP